MATPRKSHVKRKIAKRSKKIEWYFCALDINTVRYESKGKTVLESFQNLALELPKPLIIKTKGILRIEFQKKQAEQLFFGITLRRFLNNKVNMDIWGKRMIMMLK